MFQYRVLVYFIHVSCLVLVCMQLQRAWLDTLPGEGRHLDGTDSSQIAGNSGPSFRSLIHSGFFGLMKLRLDKAREGYAIDSRSIHQAYYRQSFAMGASRDTETVRTELIRMGNSMPRPCCGRLQTIITSRLLMNVLPLLIILHVANVGPFSSLPLGIKTLHIGLAIHLQSLGVIAVHDVYTRSV